MRSLLFKKRFPFGVGWNITHRCNLKCKYCNVWHNKTEELETDRVLAIIDEMASMGTRFITLSGGEPLLRHDLDVIIDRCIKHKMQVALNTNGVLVAKKIDKIKNITEAQVSLDGTREENDAVRGEGVFDKATEAIEIFHKNGIKVNISCVISRFNLKCIPELLDIADNFGVGIYFHPADRHLSGRSDAPFDVSPSEEEFKRIIEFLIKEKRKGRKSINDTISGLKHIFNWPKPTPIKCLAELLFCNIEPDGTVTCCDQRPNYQKYLVPIQESFGEAFNKLPLPVNCQKCWCGSTVEFNMVGSFKPDSMLGIWKRFRDSK